MPHNGVLLEKHHMIPKCRGGGQNGNIKMVTSKQHIAWHSLWGNATPEEILSLLLSGLYQVPERKYAEWVLLFGPYSGPAEAARIVTDEWTPISTP